MNRDGKHDLKPQVQRELYFRPGYLSPARFASYGYQLREIMSLKPETILEVGIGNGLMSYLLRKVGLKVTTLDFDESLEPDVVASVTDMPLDDNSFDVVACFEVLEHFPFAGFAKALCEICRVSRRMAVISLPDHTLRFYRIEFTLPWLGHGRCSFSLPTSKASEHKFDGEHYWEIGKKGYPLERVMACIEEAGFDVVKTYRILENPTHRMFILRKSAPKTNLVSNGRHA